MCSLAILTLNTYYAQVEETRLKQCKETDCTFVEYQGGQTVVCTWCVQVLRPPKEAFAAAMQSWRERCEKCVRLQGDYVEK